MGWMLSQSWWWKWTLFEVWSIRERVWRVRACSGALFSARLLSQRVPRVRIYSGASFGTNLSSQRVWGGPFGLGGSFQMPIAVAKGLEDQHLLGGSNPGLALAGMGPEGLDAFVSCQKSPFWWGLCNGAQDVRRASYYYAVGCSGIYSWIAHQLDSGTTS